MILSVQLTMMQYKLSRKAKLWFGVVTQHKGKKCQVQGSVSGEVSDLSISFALAWFHTDALKNPNPPKMEQDEFAAIRRTEPIL